MNVHKRWAKSPNLVQNTDFEDQNNYLLWIQKIKINSKSSDFEKHLKNHFQIMSFYYI